MRVLWICHFSSEIIRSRLKLSGNRAENIMRMVFKKPKFMHSDFANWITNGVLEFEKFEDVELHIVAPHYGMKQKTESFVIKGINYWFFKPDDDSLIQKMQKYCFKQIARKYNGNRKIIKQFIYKIDPDIINLIGAENPYYAISALDVYKMKYPLLVSLQTLLSDPEFIEIYQSDNSEFEFRQQLEYNILANAHYIGSSIQKFRNCVWKKINPDSYFMNTVLAVEENIPVVSPMKIFDFVYFAASISKAADLAIEAFALAWEKHPSLTINIIGGASEPFASKLKSRIKELGIDSNVHFSGKLKTHNDVLAQIQLSKFALLPLKVDIISGTIRESMFSGLPVVTTITAGTPSLNATRECVLISERGDHEAMARNMLKLLESEQYAEKIRTNALQTAKERWSNSRNMADLVQAYKAILDHYKNGTPIPANIAKTNPNRNYAH